MKEMTVQEPVETFSLSEALKQPAQLKDSGIPLSQARQLESPELEKQKRRGVLEDVKYFLGEGVLKPLARGVEYIPAGAESVLQTGLGYIRTFASRQLAQDGVAFGVGEDRIKERSLFVAGRIAGNNWIINNVDRALDTSKRMQNNWIEWANTGAEAPSKKFLGSSSLPWDINFSMARMVAFGFESAPLLGLAASVSLAAKSPMLGASVVGVIQASEEYATGIDKELSEEKALALFIVNSVMLSVFENVPLTNFMKGGAVPIRAFRMAWQEGTEEVLQQVWLNSVAKIGYDETRKLTEGMAENFIAGFLSGGLIGSFGPGEVHKQRFELAKDKGINVDKMQEVVAQQILDSGESINASFLEKASPEAVFVKGMEGLPIHEVVEGEVSKSVQTPMDQAKMVVQQALPQRETIGVSEAEKEFEASGSEELAADLPKVVATRLMDKFVKIYTTFKRSDSVLKRKIKAVQIELESFIKNSELDAVDRAKFLSKIKEAQTVQQLRRLLPEVKTKINLLVEKVNLRHEIKEFKKLSRVSKVMKARSEFQKDINDIIGSLTPEKIGVRKALGLESLAKHLAEDPDVIIPQYRLDELAALEKKSLRDMTAAEVQLINEGIRHAYKLSALKQFLLDKNKYVMTESAVEEILFNLSQAGVDMTDAVTALESESSSIDKVKEVLGLDSRDAELNLQKVEGVDGGRFQSMVFGALNRAKTDYLRFNTAAREFLRDGLKGIDVTRWSQYITPEAKHLDLVPFTFTGGRKPRVMKLTKGQILAFHLLMQRETGALHILEGGFHIKGRVDVVKVTEEDARAISEYVLEDKELSRVAEVLHAYFNGFQKEAINEVSYRLHGIELALEPNYFRIKVEESFRQALIDVKRQVVKVAVEGMGFLQPTVNSKLPVVLEDAFQVAYESIHHGGVYVAYAEPLRTAKSILEDRRIKQALVRQGKEDFLRSFKRYVQRVEGEIVDMNNIEVLTKSLLVKVQASILMLNPFILLKQPVSVLAAMTEIDVKYLLKGYKLGASVSEKEEIFTWSPQLAARWEGHISRELGELKNTGAIRELFTGKVGWSNKFLTAYQTADHPMVVTIWRAAKAEVKEQEPGLEGDAYFEKVAERAEYIIRRTQASVFVEHRSENLANRDPVARTLTLFSSETNKQFIMVSRALEVYRRSSRSFADGKLLAQKLFIVSFLNSFLIALINMGANIWKQSEDKGRKKEEEEDWELISKKYVSDVILGPLGMVYGVRDMVQVLQSWYVYGQMFEGLSNPVYSAASTFLKGVIGFAEASKQYLSGEKYKSGVHKRETKWGYSLGRAVRQTIEGLGALRGLPVANVFRLGGPLFKKVIEVFGD